MKRFKRLVSSTLVAAILLSNAAMAADTYTITINDSTEGNTYVAYQIFAGELSEGKLTNITWGSGVSTAGQTALGDASDVAADLTDTATAEAFATEVAPYLTTAAGSDSTVESEVYEIDNLSAGYYLIKNTTVADGETFTSYILKVVEDVEVTPKDSTVPTVEKTVNDNEEGEGSSADYAIGDNVPFTLTATLPSNVDDYEEYKLVFNDTLSAGLTYNNDAVVKIDDTEVTATITEENGVLTITLDDAKVLGATDNSIVTVEYTALLNENAVIGGEGNTNTVDLDYYNNPNFDYNGDGVGENGKTDTDGDGDVDEDDDYEDADGDGNPDGDTDGDGDVDEDDQIDTTPEDEAVVYTYELDINKVDSDDTPLAGAGFTLYKMDENGDYVAVGDEITGVTTFEFKGLDEGAYKLVETTTPGGYNTMSDVEFTISSNHDEDGFELTSDFGTVSDGTVTADVVNYTGAELPETGGMGTKVIYTVGGALVLGAVVLLVTRRRMDNE